MKNTNGLGDYKSVSSGTYWRLLEISEFHAFRCVKWKFCIARMIDDDSQTNCLWEAKCPCIIADELELHEFLNALVVRYNACIQGGGG